MDRATVKIDRDTAARLRAGKLGMSADLGAQLTTSQAIDYLLVYWQLTRDQGHIIALADDGVPYSPIAASAQPA